jgi:hypothetical protein
MVHQHAIRIEVFIVDGQRGNAEHLHGQLDRRRSDHERRVFLNQSLEEDEIAVGVDGVGLAFPEERLAAILRVAIARDHFAKVHVPLLRDSQSQLRVFRGADTGALPEGVEIVGMEGQPFPRPIERTSHGATGRAHDAPRVPHPIQRRPDVSIDQSFLVTPERLFRKGLHGFTLTFFLV